MSSAQVSLATFVRTSRWALSSYSCRIMRSQFRYLKDESLCATCRMCHSAYTLATAIR